MRILVLGAGAMGSLLGARLAGTEASVTLLGRSQDHIEAVRRDGLILEELDGTERRFVLTAAHRPESVTERPDLVLVAVKTYDTATALESIRGICGPSTIFLTLQNGVGNLERIATVVGKDAVLVGITAQGATFVSPGRIRHGGNGPTTIGEPYGPPSERLVALVDLFRSAGFATEAGAEVERLIWEKLMVNVGINAITALTGIRNGVVAENPDAAMLGRAAVLEAMAVAAAKEFIFPEDTPERVQAVARATAANRSSMGQDVDRNKETEIEAINGAVTAFGEELGIPTPVNRTLTLLVRVLQGKPGGNRGPAPV